MIRDVTRRSLDANANEFFARATHPDDVVLLYFAGHGDAKPMPCLIAADYHGKTAPRNHVSLHAAFAWAMSDPARAQNRIFIFDACRRSPAGRGEHLMAQEFYDYLRKPGDEFTILTGCQATESTYEDATLKHGRFTWTLIEAMRGAAYKEGDEKLFIDQVFKYIAQTFQDRVNWSGQQTPRIFNTAARPVAISRRRIVKPPPISPMQLKRLEEMRAEARGDYLRKDLERAESAYSLCRLALAGIPNRTEAVQRLRVTVLAEYAAVLYRLRLKEESAAAAEEAAKPPPDDPSLRVALREREGYIHLDAGKFAAAKEALDAVLKQSNEANPAAPYTWSQHGVSLKRLEKFGEAIDSFSQAAMLGIKLGCLEDAGADLEQAALCCKRTGNLEKSIELILKASELLRESHKNKKTLPQAKLMGRMSVLLAALGKFSEAESSGKEALAIRTELLGPLHPVRAPSLRQLADVYLANREYAKAQPLYEEGLNICQATLGDHRETIDLQEKLAVVVAIQRGLDRQRSPSVPSSYLVQAWARMRASIAAAGPEVMTARLGCDRDGVCMVGMSLSVGEESKLVRQFRANKQYLLVAAGDDDVRSVSLKVFGGSGLVAFGMTSGPDSSRVAVLPFTPKQSGDYRIQFKLTEATAPSACSLVVLRRDGGEVGMDQLFAGALSFLGRCTVVDARTAVRSYLLPGECVWGCVVQGGDSHVIRGLGLGGRPTVALAAGADQATDLDLCVKDGSGAVVAADRAADSTPVLLFTPKHDSLQTIVLDNASRDGKPSVGVFGVIQLSE